MLIIERHKLLGPPSPRGGALLPKYSSCAMPLLRLSNWSALESLKDSTPVNSSTNKVWGSLDGFPLTAAFEHE